MSYIERLRGFIGSHKIFLVYGCVVLEDELSRVLLQRRTDFDFWGLPGGVLELEEDIESCARRELLEETGLTAGELDLVGVYTDPRYDVVYPNGDQVQQYSVCFRGKQSGGSGRPDGVETVDQRFFTTEQLPSLDIPVWYRDMISHAQSGHQPWFSPPFASLGAVDQIENVRPLIGRDPLIAAGAAAIVVREDGRILMLRQEGESDWGFPSGCCHIGENAANTAVRVTRQETGLHIVPERIVGVYSGGSFQDARTNGSRIKQVSTLFRASLSGSAENEMTGQIAGAAWMTPAEIINKTSAKHRRLMAASLEYLDKGCFVC